MLNAANNLKFLKSSPPQWDSLELVNEYHTNTVNYYDEFENDSRNNC